MAWTLCKKEDVASIYPIGLTDLPDFWSDAIEGMIRRHLGTPYLGLSQELTELYSGDNTPVLMVRRPPIVSVTSLLIGDWLVPSTAFVVNPTSVQLLGEFIFAEGNLNTTLTYTSGGGLSVDGIIDDPIIRLTAASMIVAVAQYKGRAGSDGSIKWGNPAQADGEPSPVFNSGLTSHMQKIMKQMLRRSHLRVK